jgi:hypothetical protein
MRLWLYEWASEALLLCCEVAPAAVPIGGSCISQPLPALEWHLLVTSGSNSALHPVQLYHAFALTFTWLLAGIVHRCIEVNSSDYSTHGLLWMLLAENWY